MNPFPDSEPPRAEVTHGSGYTEVTSELRDIYSKPSLNYQMWRWRSFLQDHISHPPPQKKSKVCLSDQKSSFHSLWRQLPLNWRYMDDFSVSICLSLFSSTVKAKKSSLFIHSLFSPSLASAFEGGLQLSLISILDTLHERVLTASLPLLCL